MEGIKSTIAVEGIRLYAHHGYYREEQVLGGWYLVDIYVRPTDLSEAIEEDDLSYTVNYEQLYELCKREMAINSHLIEHLAYRIMDAILAEISGIEHIRLRLSKLAPPVGGEVARTYVELEKSIREL